MIDPEESKPLDTDRLVSEAYRKMLPKPCVEMQRWTSDNGEREDHYFLRDGKKTYLFGINPKYFSPELVEKIIEQAKGIL